jgi:LPXTG-site transpeptidase (sortase) family protein
VKNLSSVFIIIGGLMIGIAIIIFSLTYYGVFSEEIKYSMSKIIPDSHPIKPINTDFSIVIPKIQANAKVIDQVDPNNEKEYQIALTKGVAHAKGTGYPGQNNNVFIFSHSSVDWYMANRYNSVFYLLNKLEKNDEIDLYYKNSKYAYKVREKQIVDPTAVSYLHVTGKGKTVTLMTCWPPGTTLKRLIVVGEIN